MGHQVRRLLTPRSSLHRSITAQKQTVRRRLYRSLRCSLSQTPRPKTLTTNGTRAATVSVSKEGASLRTVAGLQTIVPETWRAIWNKYTDFLQYNNGTGSSVVILEAFSLVKIQSIPDDSSAFPHRHVRFHAVVIPWYTDQSLDLRAKAFGSTVHSLWHSMDSVPQAST